MRSRRASRGRPDGATRYSEADAALVLELARKLGKHPGLEPYTVCKGMVQKIPPFECSTEHARATRIYEKWKKAGKPIYRPIHFQRLLEMSAEGWLIAAATGRITNRIERQVGTYGGWFAVAVENITQTWRREADHHRARLESHKHEVRDRELRKEGASNPTFSRAVREISEAIDFS